MPGCRCRRSIFHHQRSIAMKACLRLLILLMLGGYTNADLHQAQLCEEVAKILFDQSSIDRLVSERDARAAHAVTTRVTLRKVAGGAAQHSVACIFESSGVKSADQLALTVVSSDREGDLSAARMAELRAT